MNNNYNPYQPGNYPNGNNMNNGTMNGGNGGFSPSPVAPAPKSNKKTLFLLIGVLVIVIVGVVIFLLLNHKGESESSNTNSTSNSNTNANQEEANDYYVDWVGTYENGDYTLNLYYGNDKELTFDITLSQLVEKEGQELPSASVKSSSFDIPVSSATQISYEDEFFDSKITIQLEKTATGVKLVADSDDENSVLYHLNLELTKKEFASNHWTGVYQKDNTLIVISEYDEDQVCVLVSDLPYYPENHPTTLTLEEINATITKTDTGITVTTTGDLSGDYQKK